MARISLAGFKDPKRRPRFIVWTVVAVLVLVAVMILVLGVTSTRWFCSEGCHKVQDDTITAYEHSPHSEISCMACHMPVGANPVVFLLHKAEALGELYLTVTNNFELPLNAESEVALTMKSTQCTQCHDAEQAHRHAHRRASSSTTRSTPRTGVDVHDLPQPHRARRGLRAHARPTPRPGKPNRQHEDFMEMTACFRCHSQGEPVATEAARRVRRVSPARIRAQAAEPPAARLLPRGPRQARRRRGEPHARERRDVVAQRRVDRDAAARARRRGEGEGERAPRRSARRCPRSSRSTSAPRATRRSSASTATAACRCRTRPTSQERTASSARKSPRRARSATASGGEGCDACHHGTTIGYAVQSGASRGARSTRRPSARSVPRAASSCHNPTYCANCHVNGGVPPK